MALKEKWVVLSFAQGLDTETNEKTVPVGKLTTLRNGVFTQDVTIEKRFGTEVLPRTRIGATYSIVSGTFGLATRDAGEELVQLSVDDEVLSFDDAIGGWVPRGTWTPVQLDTVQLPHRPYEAWDPTTTSNGSVRIVAWEDARGGLRGQLTSMDGIPYSTDFLIDSAGTNATARLVGGQFHVYYVYQGSVLKVATYSPGAVSLPSGTIRQLETNLLIPTGSHTGSYNYNVAPGAYPGPYSVQTVGAYAIAAWAFTGSNGSGIKFAAVNSDGFVSTDPSTGSLPAPVTYQTASTGPALAISPDGLFATAVWQETPQAGMNYGIVNARTFAQIVHHHGFDSDPEVLGNNVRRITAAYSPLNDSGSIQIVVEVSSSATTSFGQGTAAVNASIPGDHVRIWRIADSATLLRKFGSRIASEPFSLGGKNHVWLTQATALEPTDYLVRLDDGMTVARSRPGLCYTDVSGTVGNVDVRGTTVYRTATQREVVNVQGASGSSYLGRDLVLTSLDYHVSGAWQPQDVDRVLVMPGGWPGMYDGTQVVELGFGQAVEGLVAVPGSGTIPAQYGRGMAIDTSLDTVINGSASYGYAVVPEWYDAIGNRYQGACAYATTVALTGAIGLTTLYNNSASLAWQSIPHTMKDGVNAPSLNFAVYRTGPNGTVYQRVDDPTRAIVNSTGSSMIVWYDMIPESLRAQGEVLYTNGEAPNLMPLSPKYVAQAGDRVYLAGLEGEPNTITVSKLRDGGAVAFGNGEVSVDPRGGPITALATLDDNVVPFKQSRVFVFPDQGPSNAASDDTPWPIPQFVTSDVGVPRGQSAVHVAGQNIQGLMFRSLRGFRLLDRGLQVANVGAPMKGYDDLTVTAGVSPHSAEEARFYTDEGTTLVLNTRFDQWGTFDSQPSVAACIWRDQPTYGMADGRVWTEDTGSYMDAGLPITMQVETGWIPLDGLQNLSRVWEIFVLGDFYSHCQIRVEMAFDYRDSWVTARLADTVEMLGVTPYGGPPGYGSGSYGGSDPVLQFRVAVPYDRCEAFRLRFTDLNQRGSGQSFSLTEVKLHVGLESGRPSLPTRKKR